jgi:hypothetical protein
VLFKDVVFWFHENRIKNNFKMTKKILQQGFLTLLKTPFQLQKYKPRCISVILLPCKTEKLNFSKRRKKFFSKRCNGFLVIDEMIVRVRRIQRFPCM